LATTTHHTLRHFNTTQSSTAIAAASSQSLLYPWPLPVARHADLPTWNRHPRNVANRRASLPETRGNLSLEDLQRHVSDFFESIAIGRLPEVG